MNTKKNSTVAICLTAILALSPIASLAQATTTFSGEAVALRASAVGISLALSDTGALPSSGGKNSTAPASTHILRPLSALDPKKHPVPRIPTAHAAHLARDTQ